MEEARIGELGEELLTRKIEEDQSFADKLRRCIKDLTGIELVGKITAIRGRKLGLWKTDLLLIDQRRQQIGISLKTVKKGGRPDDHLDRRWLDRRGRRAKPWTEVLNMPETVREILHTGILRMARGESNQLVPPQYQAIIRDFFRNVLSKFLNEAFRNEENVLRLFAVLEYDDRLYLCLFDIDEIIKFIEKDVKRRGITFGSRINIGKYIQVQRKAGDGKHVKIPKDDPRHPGNQLQVKVMARDLRDDAIKSGVKHCCFRIDVEFSSKQRTLFEYIKESTTHY
ncbi:MAG TPA: hypothetical protein EYP08_08095 [Pyrodictiaceae archaeon]|nr:hypothetical protein [Pyrodictiaceae archaeon]